MTEQVDLWLLAEGVSKSFGAVHALAPSSISFRRGEVRGLVGPNGAGKSTLTKILCGVLEPDTGLVTVDGSGTRFRRPADAQRHGIALVPQELVLAPRMSVAENLLLGRYPRNRLGLTDRGALRKEAARALETIALVAPLSAPAGSLSLMSQRLLMVAKAVASDARLIVLDEPTAALPREEVLHVLEAIRRLAAAGVSVLYVSHRLDEIVEICDSVTALRDGRVVADVDAGELSHNRLIELIHPDLGEQVAAAPKAAVSPSPAPAVLTVTGLRTRQLADVSFDVRAGEILGVAGLVGSGVEEVLPAVVGAKRLAAGSITAHGRTLTRWHPGTAAEIGIGYLPGDRSQSVLRLLTVERNIELPSVQRISSRGIMRNRYTRIHAALAVQQTGVELPLDVPITTLSGGTQQKALLSRWLGSSAKIVLLDDPTAGVDVGARAEIHAVIRAASRSGNVSFVITSSALDELAGLCDRVLILENGRLTQERSGESLTEAGLARALFREGANGNRDSSRVATTNGGSAT